MLPVRWLMLLRLGPCLSPPLQKAHVDKQEEIACPSAPRPSNSHHLSTANRRCRIGRPKWESTAPIRQCGAAGWLVQAFPPQFPAFVSMRCGGRTTRVLHERTRVVGPQEQQRMCGRPTGKQQKKGARRWRQMTSPAWDDA
ncbi:hypothetical protein IWZ00DRAFT_52946 [Phyllosticta capitalensis]